MALLDLTTIVSPATVQLAMGIIDSDIKEDDIKETGIYDELTVDVAMWFPEYAVLLTTDPLDTQSEEVQKLALKAYCKYFLCMRLSAAGQLGFYRKMSDGQNDDSRFVVDFELLYRKFEEAAAKEKANVLGIDTKYTPEILATVNVLFGVASPSEDVVDR